MFRDRKNFDTGLSNSNISIFRCSSHVQDPFYVFSRCILYLFICCHCIVLELFFLNIPSRLLHTHTHTPQAHFVVFVFVCVFVSMHSTTFFLVFFGNKHSTAISNMHLARFHSYKTKTKKRNETVRKTRNCSTCIFPSIYVYWIFLLATDSLERHKFIHDIFACSFRCLRLFQTCAVVFISIAVLSRCWTVSAVWFPFDRSRRLSWEKWLSNKKNKIRWQAQVILPWKKVLFHFGPLAARMKTGFQAPIEECNFLALCQAHTNEIYISDLGFSFVFLHIEVVFNGTTNH